jgi:uncharacterized protein
VFNFVSFTFAVLLAAVAPSPAPPTPAPITVHAPKALLTLEVARTEAEREHGLMNRTSLAPHTGMVFVFDQDAPVEFWMKNTLIPLDMVFVGADGVVRDVAVNVPVVPSDTPDDKIPRRDGTALFVLELPAKEAAKDGIVTGTHLQDLRKLEDSQ